MDRVTFLTGASSGLGRGLAIRIAAEGHAVALVARRAELLEDLAHEIEAKGGRALPISCDVRNKDAVQAAVRQTVETLGPITRLVANAGIGNPTPAQNFKSEEFERVFDVNLRGAVYCIEAVLPSMIEHNYGHIVGVSSLAGYRGMPGAAAYCASKAALTTTLESLRCDLSGTGVDVTVVCPGFVKTPMTETNKFPMPFLMETEAGVAQIHKAIVRRIPHHAFPIPLATVVRAMRLLPADLYTKIVSGTGHTHAKGKAFT
jgi:NAD(P)-dependent dehydrogenase (short-subunit alcohol dehydrogenase family)